MKNVEELRDFSTPNPLKNNTTTKALAVMPPVPPPPPPSRSLSRCQTNHINIPIEHETKMRDTNLLR